MSAFGVDLCAVGPGININEMIKVMTAGARRETQIRVAVVTVLER